MKIKIASIIITVIWMQLCAAAADSPYTPPTSPRVTCNFNPGWKFFKGDVTGAEQPGFDDSKWTGVSAPHTWNDTDTYEGLISHNGGDRHESTGIGWYRKHFKLLAGAKESVSGI